MKFSVITPSLNQSCYIEATINSVISQSCHDQLEYIVMDGNSQDQTADILNRYQAFLTFYSEPDRGQSHAVNKGLQLATGDIIGWLNSDDIYYPNVLSDIGEYFEAHPDVDVVYGDAHLIDPAGRVQGYYVTEPFSLGRLKQRCFLSQPATFFRRRVVQQYGLLDESLQFCMDYEYWLRIAMRGARFAFLPKVLAGARLHNGTKTSQFGPQASVEAIQVTKQLLGYIPSRHLISYACALARQVTGSSYPEVRFIQAVSGGLWSVTGRYYQGVRRAVNWLLAHHAMINEFLWRGLAMLRIRLRYKHQH